MGEWFTQIHIHPIFVKHRSVPETSNFLSRYLSIGQRRMLHTHTHTGAHTRTGVHEMLLLETTTKLKSKAMETFTSAWTHFF